MTTYTILDIDGCLNSVLPTENQKLNTGHEGEWFSKYAMSASNKKYWITWNQDVVDFLQELIDSTSLVIGSTWRGLALSVIFPLVGLTAPEDTPVLDPDTEATGYTDAKTKVWWKAIRVKELVESLDPEDRVIWIDDDLAHEYAGRMIAQEMGDRMLLIHPNVREGLTRGDLLKIKSFLSHEVVSPVMV